MFQKILILIKKYKIYLSVFCVSFLINFLFLNKDNIPVIYPDSQNYFDVASEIRQFKFPNFSLRTPTYPIYLSFFKNQNSSIIPNLIIASIGSLFLYWIISKLTKNKIITFLSTVFIMADYGITNFYSTILTESIAPTIILFSVFSHIILSLPLLIISDFLLIFIKPTFFFLPLCIKVFYFIFFKNTRNKTLLISGIINFIFMASFLGYNYFQTQKIQLSSVGPVNTLGVVIRYGYLDPQPFYYDAPSEVNDIIDIYQQNKTTDPWYLIQSIKNSTNIKDINLYLIKVNNYLIWKNKKSLVIKSIENFPKNFTTERNFYSKINSKINSKISTSAIFSFLEEIYNAINRFKFIGIITGIFIFFTLFIHHNKKNVVIGTILIFSIYTISINTLLSYGEFSRLKQPVDAILSLLVLLPFYYLKPNDKNN